MNKIIIPFGNSCTVAFQLQQKNLRYIALPFDWLLCDKFSILDLIKNNFSDLFNTNHLLIKKNNNSHYLINSSWNDNNLNTIKIYNSKYKINFMHDFTNNDIFESQINCENVNYKYIRRINRFTTIMTDNSIYKILIHINKINLYDEFISIFNQLNYKNYKLLIFNYKDFENKNSGWKLDNYNWKLLFNKCLL
jgi:hypothetical protein